MSGGADFGRMVTAYCFAVARLLRSRNYASNNFLDEELSIQRVSFLIYFSYQLSSPRWSTTHYQAGSQVEAKKASSGLP